MLRWAALGLGLLLGLAGLAVLLLQTKQGQEFSEVLLNKYLNKPGVYALRLEGLRGHPPFDFEVERLEIDDGDGRWLSLQSLSIRIDPFALAAGRLDIVRLRAGVLRWQRRPRAQETRTRRPFDPQRLPRLTVESLAVDAFELSEQVAGRRLRLTLSGRAGLRENGRSTISLDVKSIEGPAARLQLSGELKGREPQLSVAAEFEEEPGGLLGALLRVPQSRRGRISLQGEAPLSQWQGRLEIDYGDGARLQAGLSYDSSQRRAAVHGAFDSTAVRVWLAPQRAFAAREVSYEASLVQGEQGAKISITADAAGLGLETLRVARSSLHLEAEPRGQGIYTINASLDSQGLSSGSKATVPPLLGASPRLTLLARIDIGDKRGRIESLRVEGDGAVVEGSFELRPQWSGLDGVLELELSEPRALSAVAAGRLSGRASIKMHLAADFGEASAKGRIEGHFDSLSPSVGSSKATAAILALLGSAADLSAEFAIAGREAGLEAFVIDGQALRLSGSGNFSFDTRSVSLEALAESGDLSAAAPAVDAVIAGSGELRLSLSGSLDALDVELSAEAAGLRGGDVPVESAHAGLSGRWESSSASGRAYLELRNGESIVRGESALLLDEERRLTLSGLRVEGPFTRLSADLAISLKSAEIQGELDAECSDLSVLSPFLAGTAQGEARLSVVFPAAVSSTGGVDSSDGIGADGGKGSGSSNGNNGDGRNGGNGNSGSNGNSGNGGDGNSGDGGDGGKGGGSGNGGDGRDSSNGGGGQRVRARLRASALRLLLDDKRVLRIDDLDTAVELSRRELYSNSPGLSELPGAAGSRRSLESSDSSSSQGSLNSRRSPASPNSPSSPFDLSAWRGNAVAVLQGLSSGELSFSLSRLRAYGEDGGWRLEVETEGSAPAPFELSSRLQVRRGGEALLIGLEELSASYAEYPLELQEPATAVLSASAFSIDSLKLDIAGQGGLFIDGELWGDAASTQVVLENLPLRLISIFVPTLSLSGFVDGRIGFHRSGDSTEAELDLFSDDLSTETLSASALPPLSAGLRGSWKGGHLILDAQIGGLRDTDIEAHAELPLPFSAEVDSLSASLRWQGELGDITALLPLGENLFSGKVDADLLMDGSVGCPRIRGHLSLAEGNYEGPLLGLSMRGIQAELEGRGDRLVLTSFSAGDGADGTFSADGHLQFAGLDDYRIDFDLRSDNARVFATDTATVLASGALQLSGSREGSGSGALFYVSGRLQTPRVDVFIPKRFRQEVVSLDVVELQDGRPLYDDEAVEQRPPPGVLQFDIEVEAPRRVYISGRGLESEWKGSLSVGGSNSRVEIQGAFEVVHGSIDVMGRRFKITKGSVVFDGYPDNPPRMELEAEAKASDIVATLSLHGDNRDFKLEFSSEPPLPEDEVLSRVLFGESASDLTPMQSIQLAQALAELSGKGLGGGGSILDQLGRAVGLDKLGLGKASEGLQSALLSVGKYLGEGIYVNVEQGLTPDSSKVTVEVDLTDNITLESDVGRDAQSQVGLNWRWDY